MSDAGHSRGPAKKKGLRGFGNGFPSSVSGRSMEADHHHVGRGRDVLVPEFRAKLCDAMATLEREYEVLYLENEALRKKVDELSEVLETHGIRSDGTIVAVEAEVDDVPEAIATTPPSATARPAHALGVSPPPPSSSLRRPIPTSATMPAIATAKTTATSSPRLVKKLSASSRVTRLKTTYRAGANKIRRITAYATVEARRCFVGHTDGIWDVSHSPLTNSIATASADHSVRLWCADSSACLLKYVGHAGSVNSVRFHPNLPIACSASGDSQIHMWRVPASATSPVGGQVSKSSSQMTTIAQLPQSPSFDTILGGSMEQQQLSSQQSQCDSYYTDMSNIANWAQGQDSHGLSDDELNEQQGEDQCENTDKLSLLRTPTSRLVGHLGVVIAADWMAGGSHVASASWDRTVKLWDAESAQCVSTLTGHDQELTNVSCHPTEKFILTSGRDTTFRMWDLNSFDCHPVHVLQAHSGTVTSAIFSSKGHVISASDDRTVKVWDMRQMRSPTVTIRASTPVNRIAVSAGARLLALPQDNRHVRVFDINGVRLDKSSQKQGHRRMVSAATFVPSEDVLEDHITMFSVGFDNRLISWSIQLPGS